MKRAKRLIGVVALVIGLGAVAGCYYQNEPTVDGASVWCNASAVSEPGGIRFHSTSNVRAGEEVILNLYGNGALLGSLRTSVGYAGTLDVVIPTVPYGYPVEWYANAVWAGKVLCEANAHTDL